MQLINLCRRPVVIVTETGERIVIEPEARPARARSFSTRSLIEVTHKDKSYNITTMLVDVLGADNLPDPEPDTLFIVPIAVAKSRPDRTDLVFCGGVTRDAMGTIVETNVLVFERLASG